MTGIQSLSQHTLGPTETAFICIQVCFTIQISSNSQSQWEISMTAIHTEALSVYFGMKLRSGSTKALPSSEAQPCLPTAVQNSKAHRTTKRKSVHQGRCVQRLCLVLSSSLDPPSLFLNLKLAQLILLDSSENSARNGGSFSSCRDDSELKPSCIHDSLHMNN